MRAPASRRPIPALALAAVLLAGCASGYDTGYDFQPRPREAPVRCATGRAGCVSAVVLGVREGGSDGPAAIDVKVRVERHGDVPVAAPASGMRLVTADRESLVASDHRAIGPVVAAAGGASTSVVTFPLPGRDPAKFDLSALDLVVAVDVGDRRETVRLPFQRGASAVVWLDPWGWPGPDYNGNPTGWRR